MVNTSFGTVAVEVEGERYPVALAPGFVGLGHALSMVLPAGRVVVVTNDVVGPLHAAAAEQALRAGGWEPVRLVLPDGERHKNLDTWRDLVGQLLDVPVDRRTPVLALGGGVTGDMVGFAAAAVLRGVPLIQVPTTLLAMVDASVGGKVAVNTPQGKNLVGAFWQPRLVYAPFAALDTLPDAELRCGFGEVVKHAMLSGECAFAELEADALALRSREPEAVARAVRASVLCKAAVVAADPREIGTRATLNLGHTLAHAIETVAGYGTIRHGEAVAMGLVGVTRYCEAVGWSHPGLSRRIAALCIALGIPCRPVDDLDRDALIRAVAFDKKRDRATIKLVVPAAIGQVALQSVPLTEVPALVNALFES